MFLQSSIPTRKLASLKVRNLFQFNYTITTPSSEYRSVISSYSSECCVFKPRAGSFQLSSVISTLCCPRSLLNKNCAFSQWCSWLYLEILCRYPRGLVYMIHSPGIITLLIYFRLQLAYKIWGKLEDEVSGKRRARKSGMECRIPLQPQRQRDQEVAEKQRSCVFRFPVGKISCKRRTGLLWTWSMCSAILHMSTQK